MLFRSAMLNFPGRWETEINFCWVSSRAAASRMLKCRNRFEMLKPWLQPVAPRLSLKRGVGLLASGRRRSVERFRTCRVVLQPSPIERISAWHALRDGLGSLMQSQFSGPPILVTICPISERHSSQATVSPDLAAEASCGPQFAWRGEASA